MLVRDWNSCNNSAIKKDTIGNQYLEQNRLLPLDSGKDVKDMSLYWEERKGSLPCTPSSERTIWLKTQ